MTGYVALRGTAVLAGHYYDILTGRLPISVVNAAKYTTSQEEVQKALCIAGRFGSVTYEVSIGGIYKALRDIADRQSTGITVYNDRLFIRQQTVEVCEIIDVNPYYLDGTGSIIAISERGNELVRALEEAGITANVIGYTTDNKDKIIINNGETRYLETRIGDELERLGIY